MVEKLSNATKLAGGHGLPILASQEYVFQPHLEIRIIQRELSFGVGGSLTRCRWIIYGEGMPSPWDNLELFLGYFKLKQRSTVTPNRRFPSTQLAKNI